MNTQATIKRVRREQGKRVTLTRRDIARIRESERRNGEQAFAALLASVPASEPTCT
jgi:hypothetical protein